MARSGDVQRTVLPNILPTKPGSIIIHSADWMLASPTPSRHHHRRNDDTAQFSIIPQFFPQVRLRFLFTRTTATHFWGEKGIVIYPPINLDRRENRREANDRGKLLSTTRSIYLIYCSTLKEGEFDRNNDIYYIWTQSECPQ